MPVRTKRLPPRDAFGDELLACWASDGGSHNEAVSSSSHSFGKWFINQPSILIIPHPPPPLLPPANTHTQTPSEIRRTMQLFAALGSYFGGTREAKSPIPLFCSCSAWGLSTARHRSHCYCGRHDMVMISSIVVDMT